MASNTYTGYRNSLVGTATGKSTWYLKFFDVSAAAESLGLRDQWWYNHSGVFTGAPELVGPTSPETYTVLPNATGQYNQYLSFYPQNYSGSLPKPLGWLGSSWPISRWQVPPVPSPQNAASGSEGSLTIRARLNVRSAGQLGVLLNWRHSGTLSPNTQWGSAIKTGSVVHVGLSTTPTVYSTWIGLQGRYDVWNCVDIATAQVHVRFPGTLDDGIWGPESLQVWIDQMEMVWVPPSRFIISLAPSGTNQGSGYGIEAWDTLEMGEIEYLGREHHIYPDGIESVTELGDHALVAALDGIESEVEFGSSFVYNADFKSVRPGGFYFEIDGYEMGTPRILEVVGDTVVDIDVVM